MGTKRWGAALAAAALGLGGAGAQPLLREVDVSATRQDLQGIAASASEGVVAAPQLRTRPLLRAGDIMESVPGLVATQHAGEGKANQYFLRGFNLDHGTDFATFVDGVPVNLPTHGHGQGYTDLYFVIPELVESVQYRKGPYWAEEGDFAAAGSARLRTVRRLPQPLGRVEAGSGGWRRVLAAGSFGTAAGDLLLAGERTGDDGPWDVPQGLRKRNLVARLASGTDAQGSSIGLTHYEAQWISTDQVPQRAIDAGLIGRFGSLDPTAGGRTRRTGLDASWAAESGGVRSTLAAYALRYRFDLFSNFSYFTRSCDADPLPAACGGPDALDQFEQVDARRVCAVAASQARELAWGGRGLRAAWGAELRRDDIAQVGLYDTFRRERLATVRSDSVRLDALGLWSQAELELAPGWRGVAGARWDRRAARVDSSVAANSGSRRASIFSPKASLAYSPGAHTDLYANWGRGFHSNDARGTVIRVEPRDGSVPADRATPLVRAQGWELGTRGKWAPGLVVTAAYWSLRLDSELLFVGDAGTTEASRPSRRRGVEFTANWRPAPGWVLDADLSLSRARFADADPAGDRIPGAMERVATLGLTHARGAWTFGARIRHFGPRPLLEDDSLRGSASTLVNARAAWRVTRNAELSLEVFNLFDRRANDIEYAYASRLSQEPAFSEGSAAPALHLHPSLPRSLRLGLGVTF